jgi:hypothetical protein
MTKTAIRQASIYGLVGPALLVAVMPCELVVITFICYRFMGLPDVLLTRSSQALAACDR